MSDASRPLPIRTMPSMGASRVGSISHPCPLEIDLEHRVKIRRIEAECVGADGASRNAERTRKRDAEMREIPADPGAVHERPLRRRLSVADAGDVVDVTVDLFENGHHAGDAIARGGEFASCEPHEFVRRTKAARQQKWQDVVRKFGPEVLTSRRSLPARDFNSLLQAVPADRAGDAGSRGFSRGQPAT